MTATCIATACTAIQFNRSYRLIIELYQSCKSTVTYNADQAAIIEMLRLVCTTRLSIEMWKRIPRSIRSAKHNAPTSTTCTGKHRTLRRVWYRVLTFVFHHGTLGTVIMCAFRDWCSCVCASTRVCTHMGLIAPTSSLCVLVTGSMFVKFRKDFAVYADAFMNYFHDR